MYPENYGNTNTSETNRKKYIGWNSNVPMGLHVPIIDEDRKSVV